MGSNFKNSNWNKIISENDSDGQPSPNRNNRRFHGSPLINGNNEVINGSPQLNISRQAYTLSNFNAEFRRTSQVPGHGRARTATSEMLEIVKPKCTSPIQMLKSFLPIISWVSKYGRADLLADIIAGLTVAVFQVPESMGYSFIAQVPPIYCLYTSFFPALIYFFLGTSKHCSIGTVAAVALMTGSIIRDVQTQFSCTPNLLRLSNFSETTTIAPTSTTNSCKFSEIEIATIVALLVGAYQLILGILRFGFISVYLSEQLINGFTSAVAYHVLIAQLIPMIGMNIRTKSGPFGLLSTIMNIIKHITTSINLVSLIISIICLVALLIFKLQLNKVIQKRFNAPFPVEILVVVAGVLASNILDLKTTSNIKVIGSIPLGLPAPTVHQWELIKYVWIQCIPLSVVAYALNYSLGKKFANKHDYDIDSSQEFVALGCCNLFSSFFSCIPASSSLSRSAIQEGSGGKTQLVSLVNCATILAVLLYLGRFLEELPSAVLASIIAVALRELLCSVNLFKKYWIINKLDASIWLVTFSSVIVLDIDYGLIIGVVFSLITLIYKSQRPKVYLLGSVGNDVYVPLAKYINSQEVDRIKIYQFCGPLHFANTDYFKNGLEEKMMFTVKEIKKSIKKKELNQTSYDSNKNFKNCSGFKNTKIQFDDLPTHIIIECSMFSYIDTAGVRVLKQTIAEYESIGIKTFLAGCPTHVTKILEKDHFYAAVPDHHVFLSIHDAVEHALENHRERSKSVSLKIEEEGENCDFNDNYDSHCVNDKINGKDINTTKYTRTLY